MTSCERKTTVSKDTVAKQFRLYALKKMTHAIVEYGKSFKWIDDNIGGMAPGDRIEVTDDVKALQGEKCIWVHSVDRDAKRVTVYVHHYHVSESGRTVKKMHILNTNQVKCVVGQSISTVLDFLRPGAYRDALPCEHVCSQFYSSMASIIRAIVPRAQAVFAGCNDGTHVTIVRRKSLRIPQTVEECYAEAQLPFAQWTEAELWALEICLKTQLAQAETDEV